MALVLEDNFGERLRVAHIPKAAATTETKSTARLTNAGIPQPADRPRDDVMPESGDAIIAVHSGDFVRVREDE